MINISNIPENVKCIDYLLSLTNNNNTSFIDFYTFSIHRSNLDFKKYVKIIAVPIQINEYLLSAVEAFNMYCNITRKIPLSKSLKNQDIVSLIKLDAKINDKRYWERIFYNIKYLLIGVCENGKLNLLKISNKIIQMLQSSSLFLINELSCPSVSLDILHLQQNPLICKVDGIIFGSSIYNTEYWNRSRDIIVLEKWYKIYNLKVKIRTFLLGKHKRVGSKNIINNMPNEIIDIIIKKTFLFESTFQSYDLREKFGLFPINDRLKNSPNTFYNKHIKKVHEMYYYIDDLCNKRIK
jgi:hypothetical protein